MSAIYRVRQFGQAAVAWVRPEDLEKVRSHLPPPALTLFQAMPRYDRHHAIRVFRTLRTRGQTDPDLLAAALLHDVGKTVNVQGRLKLWHRVVAVLMRVLWPGLLEAVGQERPGSWRYPFFIQRHHAAIGAEQARKAGCSPKVVNLILHHEDPLEMKDDPLLAALQAADSVN